MKKLSRNYARWTGELSYIAELLSDSSNSEEVSNDLADALFYAALRAKCTAEAIMRIFREENDEPQPLQDA